MKLHKIFIATGILAIGLGFQSCNDDDIFTEAGKEAIILGGDDLCNLRLTGNSGLTWKSKMDGNTIYILINPDLDPFEELNGTVAQFFVSKGALVDPDPAIPQNFAQDGGVEYTVISEDGSARNTYLVTYSSTAVPEYGTGYTLGTQIVEKKFPELGFPGEQGNYGFSDSRQYGDLNGYVGFCGHNHIVLMSRQYTAPALGDASLNVPDAELGLRVYNKQDLSYVGKLNIGSIDMKNLMAITSDMDGILVGAVVNGGSCDIYYWTSYNSSPLLLGSVQGNLCSTTDGSSHLSIMGKLNDKANISGHAGRDQSGSHYMIHVENNQIVDTQVIETGARADDGNGFQMISPLTSELNSSYMFGDVEGTGNGSIKVMAKTYKGTTKVTMPAVFNGSWQSWWVGTGSNITRTGARRPYVNSMLINGVHYALIMNGTAWWWHNDIAGLDDLSTRVNGTSWAYSVNLAWSFGGCSDWYWDDQRGDAYVVYYTDRYGMAVFRLTCF